MADDETVKGRSAPRASRTTAAIRSAGHAASGGHSITAITNRWRHQPGDQERTSRMSTWHEFPKWVWPDSPDGSYGESPSKKGQVLVQNQAEEAAVLGGKPVVREADERARLLKVAEVKGVTVDGRWSLKRLAEAIEAQGFDPGLNPFA